MPQLTAGIVVKAIAVLLTTCWHALEASDPALMPAATALINGWPAAAEAYAGWPRQAAASAKAAYFLRHLPQLMAHVHLVHR